MQRLEYDSYYKFLVSMGIVLVVTPIIILGIFLSGRFDLIMSQADFEGLCAESARAVNLHFTIAKALPWAFLVCSIAAFIAGGRLIHLGCKEWKVIQGKQNKKLHLEVEDLDTKVHKLSPEEKANKQIAEVVELQNFENKPDASTIETGKIIAQKALESTDAEDRCAKIIRDEIGADYTIVQNVKVGDFEYDIIALTSNNKEDVIYEVKDGRYTDISDLIHRSIPLLIKAANNYSAIMNKNVRAELWITGGCKVPDSIYMKSSEIDVNENIPITVRFTDMERVIQIKVR